MRRPLEPGQRAFPSKANNTGVLEKIAIVRVGADGKVASEYVKTGILLLNPESMEESIVSNWIPNAVPGQSLPPLFWAHGGPRAITFDALVTRDTGDFLKPANEDPISAVIDTAVNAVGSIASSFMGVKVPPLGDLFGGFSNEGKGEQLSVVDKLSYYRSLCYPNYAEGIIDTSPPLVVIYAGKTLGNKESTPTGQLGLESDVWVLVDLKIRFTKWLPNLTPMEATCSFRFLQYPIIPLSRGHFGYGPVSTAISGQDIASKLKGLF